MNLDEYIISKNEIINGFDKKFKAWQDDMMMAKFNVVSACLSNYLPLINCNEHENIFKNILLHQQLSIFEQSFYDLPDYISYQNYTAQIKTLLQKGGNIICTFHTGSYRMINLFLAKQNVPYTLVLSKEAIGTQGEAFKKIFDELNEGREEKLEFKIIEAESSVSALQMIKELKKGRNLVIYIDGNSGAGSETTENQNNCCIDFLNQKIFARQGVGFMAQALQVPVLTVASFRKSFNDIRLKFFDPIFPDPNMDRTSAAKKVTKQIFDLITPIIKEYPEQWEAWLYLHKVACVESEETDVDKEIFPVPAANDQIIFNLASFGIFKIVENTFLFKKSSYKSYKISPKVYTQLVKCMAEPVKRKDIDIPEFGELYQNKVLVSI